MIKKVLIGLIALLFFPSRVFAVTVTINDPPSSLSSSEFILNITVSGAQDGNNYLRVDLYKDGTNKYFGETYNGNDWYSGSDGTQYSPITIVSGQDWTGDIKSRVGSPSFDQYDGQGSYKLRIRRYTGSGSGGGENPDASAVPITINIPTQTPTPTPIPTNTPTPTPTNSPTNTPTPTPTKTPTPTPSKGPSPTLVSKPSPTTPQVLAANTSNQAPQQRATSDSNVDLGSDLSDLEQKKEQGYNWWKLFIVMGSVIITGAVGVFLYNNHIKERSEELGQST